MKIQWNKKTAFDIFTEQLKDSLENLDIRKLENPGYRHASVMILLMNKDDAPHILLTLRTDKVKTHKGQISLPGGGHDDEDTDFLETAYRETFEEVGISKEQISYIGQFDDYISIFGFHISVYLGSIPYPTTYNFNPGEIDDYIEAPLEIFVNESYDHLEYYDHEGTQYKIYHYLYKTFDIWGLTARILTDFGKRLFIPQGDKK